MPNTARWLAWLAMERQSDAVLVQLATMAAAAVLIWESMRRLPEPWRERARSGYLVALLLVFTYLAGGSMDTMAYAWALVVVGGIVIALFALFWWVRQKVRQDWSAADVETAKLTARLSIFAGRQSERKEKQHVEP